MTKNYATDIKTVKEFLQKYYKPDRFLDKFKGTGYQACLITSHQKYFDEYGYDLISRHDSITGEAVYFKYEQKNEIGI